MKIMNGKEKKLRIYDALTAYGICLIVAGLVGVVLRGYAGLPALYISELLSLAGVLLIAKKNRLRARALFRFGRPDAGEAVGGSLIFTAAFLTAIPLLLLGQLVFPGAAFSDGTYGISSAVGQMLPLLRYINTALVIALTALCEEVLFGGYIYTVTKGVFGISRGVLIYAAMYAVYKLDFYLLLPYFVIEAAVSYIRFKTGEMTIPLVLHIISGTVAAAVSDVCAGAAVLPGESLGGVQVVGMGMIFIGAAVPAAFAGMRLFGDLKNKPLYVKALGLLFSVVLIAAGYAVSHL